MDFTSFDKKMRVYEESLDQIIPPENYIVARLDGKSFHKFVKRVGYDRPFDSRFKDRMVNTVKELITSSGFKINYGYTQSDEISLLFDLSDQMFNHKTRKLNSVLASVATASFNKNFPSDEWGLFDCRIAPLPNKELVIDYFIWRQEDANRNALNTWCYWTLRKDGLSEAKATSSLLNKSIAYKNELLFSKGINYNDVPSWQKRGIGCYIKNVIKEGYNPKTKQSVTTTRRSLITEEELSIKDEYKKFINTFC